MEEHEKIMCPSSKATPGAKLLGVRQEDGMVAILPQPLRIDDTFIEVASQASPAEQHFRFTNKCIESGCAQWTGSRCGVADQILTVMDQLVVSDTLPECGIRPACRWYRQNGPDACKVCPFVITHTTEEDWEMRSMLHLPVAEEPNQQELFNL